MKPIDLHQLNLTGADVADVLAIGTNGDPEWQAPPRVLYDAKGDILVAVSADTPARLAVGSNGQVLTADSTQTTGVKWATPVSSYISQTLVDAKGDIVTATANDTPARLAVGADGYVLTADASQSTGLKWSARATILLEIAASVPAGTPAGTLVFQKV